MNIEIRAEMHGEAIFKGIATVVPNVGEHVSTPVGRGKVCGRIICIGYAKPQEEVLDEEESDVILWVDFEQF